ncbi:hypothetical protein NE865_08455 [Phthorimaea operculella]|nr:hypothetical protein NE865_08455 [Phthorimaea operculella]
MTPNKSIAACAKCKKDVQPKDRMHCTGCKNLFHIDCVISEKRYLLLDKERKANWSCPTCQRKRNTESENKGSPILTVPPKTHKDMTAKKSDSPTLPIVKVHDPTQQETNVAGKNSECPSGMKQEIVAMKEEIIQCLEARMEVLIKEQMDRWMEYFAAQIKQLSETVDSFKSRFLTIEERVDSLEKLVGSQEKDTSLALTVQRLKIEINARDQELLANDVEITGIPETNGENPIHIVTLVGNKLGVQVEERDVAGRSLFDSYGVSSATTYCGQRGCVAVLTPLASTCLLHLVHST